MSKKPKNTPDEPALGPEDRFLAAVSDLLGESGPTMVSAWVFIVEWLDEEGQTRLGAFSSNMPPWRLSGMVEAGHEMLAADYEYDDEE